MRRRDDRNSNNQWWGHDCQQCGDSGKTRCQCCDRFHGK
jgi:hypothetical protein